MGNRRSESHVLEVGLVAEVLRLLEMRLPESLIRRVEVLTRLRVGTPFVPLGRRLRMRGSRVQSHDAGKQQHRREGPDGEAVGSSDRWFSATHAAFVCVLYVIKILASAEAPTCQ